MKFIIDSGANLKVSDNELVDLLSRVYVQGGFVPADMAETVFDPVRVRARGVLFASREVSSNDLSGMVIVVPPGSSASVMAEDNECEMHLLAVNPRHRGHGLGRRLVGEVIDFASQRGWSKIVLLTQKSMKEAQCLYESLGFVRSGELEKKGMEFWVYERSCV